MFPGMVVVLGPSILEKKTDEIGESSNFAIPIGSMYGIFRYIYHQNQPNVGIYTIHGSCGFCHLQIARNTWRNFAGIVGG